MSTAEAKVLEARALTYQDYSTQRKAEVLALVAANDGNVQKTALEVGIPHQTIRHWLKQSDRYSQIQTTSALNLADKLEVIAHSTADSLAEHDLSIVSFRDKAAVLAVAVDKMQLLRGLPTSINAEVERQELVVILQSALSAGLEGDAIDVTPGSEHNPLTDSPDNGLTHTPE